jgi:hypothetical protein
MTVRFTLVPLPSQEKGDYPQHELPNIPKEKAESLIKSLQAGGKGDRYIQYESTKDGEPRFFYLDASRVVAAGAHPDDT